MHQPLAIVLLLVGGVLVTGIVLFTSSSLFACYVLDSIRRILRLSKREVKPNAQQELTEAHRGTTEGMFSTGPEAFNHYLGVSQNATLKGEREVPSLLDTVTALANSVDAKDHYTQGHPQKVSRIAAQIARQREERCQVPFSGCQGLRRVFSNPNRATAFDTHASEPYGLLRFRAYRIFSISSFGWGWFSHRT